MSAINRLNCARFSYWGQGLDIYSVNKRIPCSYEIQKSVTLFKNSYNRKISEGRNIHTTVFEM